MHPRLFTHKKLTAGAVLPTSVMLFGFHGTWDRLPVASGQARAKADEIHAHSPSSPWHASRSPRLSSPLEA